ncbi:hypothetical protein [Marinicellulosiphila megalodicopiae]|uniref:hypothetical protein n=1 Tax=Marinicellulosiphila megalodicopiae TaxID=2724896 RepID=UPI003BAF7C15
MIYEYAIEPEIIIEWSKNTRDFREFFDKYGLGSPRIFSSFPKGKPNKLRTYLLENGPDENKRYIEMVNYLIKSLVLRSGNCSNEKDWVKKVVHESNQKPFGVVLTNTSLGIQRSVTLSSMYDLESLWHHKDQKSIQRTSDGISSVISNLFSLSTKKIVIIDPYGWTSDFIKQIQILINDIKMGRINNELPKVIVYFQKSKKGDNPNADYVSDEIIKGLSECVENFTIDVYELTENDNSDEFHNRCVLTEHGGVMLGHGIGIKGEEFKTDDAVLLKSEIFYKKWDQFVENNTFEVVSRSTTNI